MNFLKYLLVLTFLLQSGSKSLLYLSFINNQAFIAKNICEKKAIKKNKCNGKCHLKKQMQKDDDAQQGETKLKKEKSETTYILTFQNNITLNIVKGFYKQIPFESESLPTTFHLELIKPPTTA